MIHKDLTLTPLPGTDTTPPVTTQTGADGAWHTGPIIVTLSATDGGSGVDRTEYRVDGGAWRVGNSLRFRRIKHKCGGGVFTIDYRSVDKAGNVEACKTCEVKLL